ncbi:MAG: hypothetical protein EOO27_16755 [Comamonadaceae bacterium]|nr:MAG: hypothetical protein EOO27_16755 [Comamonadaceae bacterium]
MPTQVHAITVRDDTGALRTLQILTRTPNGASSDANGPAEYLLEGVPVEKVGDKSYRVTSTGVELTEVDPSDEP